jgi:hypothetical protein
MNLLRRSGHARGLHHREKQFELVHVHGVTHTTVFVLAALKFSFNISDLTV